MVFNFDLRKFINSLSPLIETFLLGALIATGDVIILYISNGSAVNLAGLFSAVLAGLGNYLTSYYRAHRAAWVVSGELTVLPSEATNLGILGTGPAPESPAKPQ